MDHRLQIELARVAARHARLRFRWTLSACWLVVAAVAGVLTVICVSTGRSGGSALGAVALGAFLAWLVARTWLVPHRAALQAAARRVETTFPDLDQRLLAAIEQKADWPLRRYGYLQEVVVEDALRHAREHSWSDAVPATRLRWAGLAHLATLGLMIGAMATLAIVPRTPAAARLRAASRPANGSAIDIAVEPGDTEIERGTDLLVLARFHGPLPVDVRLAHCGDARSWERRSLSRSLDDPIFGGRIPGVRADLTYRVEYHGRRTRDFRVTVFDFPAVERMDAQLTYPAYTAIPAKLVEDTRQVSAVEGSTLTLICRTNKPVARAWLIDQSGIETALEAAADRPQEYRHTITVERSRRWTVRLEDPQGRRNKFPPEFVLTALPNRPPELAIQVPGRDTSVSPLEEFGLRASAWDDFGLTAYGLTYGLGGESPRSITLGQAVPAQEKREFAHTLLFEDMQAKPDQMVAYHLWAEDIGPDGRPRRSMSDMYFAEVRHFEEIFRQGEQPAGGARNQQQQPQQGQGGAMRQLANLAELQKQIISATWKLIRQHPGPKLAEPAVADVGVVRQSQQQAAEQAEQMKERARDDTASQMIVEVSQQMARALEQLAEAEKSKTPAALQPALVAEQAAYQALLALRAREHRVVRQQMQQQAGAGGGNMDSRFNRQLQELELDHRENRYETQRTASPQQAQANREDNQVLNRLRELARRQEDLNKQVRELENALQEAKTAPERNELRRRLQRLREEQQQLLRDLDELRNRMDQPENQQRMADARQQLEQTRENMRQASDAMQQNQLAESLTSGTRAQRQLEQTRDQFRKRSASQFEDEMRQLRQQARELSERQQDVDEKLEQMARSPQRSLRDEGRKEITGQLEEQGQRLTGLTDQMKTVSEESEATEPLLSRQLYDTLRDTHQRKLPDNLKMTGELLRRGFLHEGTQAEKKVRQDVEQLRQGVERAARSVLGNPEEATRRALQEVEDLTRQVETELAQADPAGQQRESQRRQPAEGESPDRPDRSATPPSSGDATQERQKAAERKGAGGTRPEPSKEREKRGERGGDRNAPRKDNQHQPGQNDRGGQRPGDQPAESRTGERPDGSQPGTERRPSGTPQGQPPAAGERQAASGQRGTPQADQPGGRRTPAGAERPFDAGGWTGPAGPITGDQFREWSDRLRDVEEMLDDPALRSDTARIRENARQAREQLKRHSAEPQWDLVRQLVAEPLVELQAKLRAELARMEPGERPAPIDRDPVPRRFAEQVRRYYERLGSGK